MPTVAQSLCNWTPAVHPRSQPSPFSRWKPSGSAEDRLGSALPSSALVYWTFNAPPTRSQSSSATPTEGWMSIVRNSVFSALYRAQLVASYSVVKL